MRNSGTHLQPVFLVLALDAFDSFIMVFGVPAIVTDVLSLTFVRSTRAGWLDGRSSRAAAHSIVNVPCYPVTEPACAFTPSLKMLLQALRDLDV
jgi:hypothetical protein